MFAFPTGRGAFQPDGQNDGPDRAMERFARQALMAIMALNPNPQFRCLETSGRYQPVAPDAIPTAFGSMMDLVVHFASAG